MKTPSGVPVVGMIGGVGSGKSSLANWLRGKLRVCVLDADAAGHRTLAQPEIREQVRQAFGDEVFGSDGAVRRDRLAARVFGPEEVQRAARRRLEALVHPAIREDLQQQLETARRSGACDVIVLDAAVLLEAGWHDVCDTIVFVQTPLDQRVRRVADSRGWSAEELQRRDESQFALHEKQAAADLIIDNSGSLEDAGRQLWEFLQRLRQVSR